MPEYCFRCGSCGHERTVVRPMCDSSLPEQCRCGESMSRNFQAEQCSTRGDYSEPIVSSSLAFAASEAEAHRRKHPNVDLEIDGQFAYPILRSLSQKREYLKARGWKDQNAFV